MKTALYSATARAPPASACSHKLTEQPKLRRSMSLLQSTTPNPRSCCIRFGVETLLRSGIARKRLTSWSWPFLNRFIHAQSNILFTLSHMEIFDEN